MVYYLEHVGQYICLYVSRSLEQVENGGMSSIAFDHYGWYQCCKSWRVDGLFWISGQVIKGQDRTDVPHFKFLSALFDLFTRYLHKSVQLFESKIKYPLLIF